MIIMTVHEYFKLSKKDRAGALLMMSNGDEFKIENISVNNLKNDLYSIKVKDTVLCKKGDEEIILFVKK